MAAIGESGKLSAGVPDSITNVRSRTTSSRRHNHRGVRPLVYVTRRIPQVGVDILLKTCDVKQWDSELAVPKGELLYSVVGADAILCMQGDNIDFNVLNAAGPNLQIVATVSHGTGHIDVEECHKRGIQVITCPAHSTEILAELTIVLVLLTIKESQTEEERLKSCESPPPDLITSDSDNSLNSLAWTSRRPYLRRRMSWEQLAFQWNKGKPQNTNCSTWKSIIKKTFGVYGLTKLGIQFAKILKTIGVDDVLIADQDAELDDFNVGLSETDCEFVSVEELLKKSDVVCICGSTGERSKELFCKESFQKMNKQAIFIVSQSQERTVNYMDLYTSLRHGYIRAAGLNDCNQEPVLFKTLLLGMKNCIFLPQTQESVFDMRHKVSVLIAKNLTETLKSKTRTIT